MDGDKKVDFEKNAKAVKESTTIEVVNSIY